jgi:hypothetical protein
MGRRSIMWSMGSALVRCISSMMESSKSVNSVHQECWKPPVHTRLILASNGLQTSKEEGECSMPGKDT